MGERSKYRKLSSWSQWNKPELSPSVEDANSTYQGILCQEIFQVSSIPTTYSTALAITEPQAIVIAVQALWMALYWETLRFAATLVIYGFDPYSDLKLNERPSAVSENSQTTRSGESPNPPSRYTSSISQPSHTTAYGLKKRLESDGRNDESGDPPPKKRKTLVNSSPCLEARLFACPFHKRSPPSCGGPGWKSVGRVKDHLYKLHLVSRCEICSAAFSNEASVDAHRATQPHCEARNEIERDGVDLSQLEKIETILKEESAKPGGTDVSKWFRMWKVLFPECDAPADPWHQTETILLHSNCEFTTEEHNGQAEQVIWGSTRSSTMSSASHDFSHGYVSDTSSSMSITPSLISDNSSGMSRASSLSAQEPRPWQPSVIDLLNSDHSPLPVSILGVGILGNGSGQAFDMSGDFLRDESDNNCVPHLQKTGFPFPVPNEVLDTSQFPSWPRTHWMDCNSGPLYDEPRKSISSIYPACSDEDTHVLQSSINFYPSTSSPIPMKSSQSPSTQKDDDNDLFPTPNHGEFTGFSVQHGALEAYSPLWDSGIETLAALDTNDNDIIPVSFESIETCLKEFLEPDSEHTTRSVSLFQAKWDRENISPSPGVISCATSEDSPTPGSVRDSTAISSLGKRGTASQPKKNLHPNEDSNENEEGDEEEDERRHPKKQKVNRGPEDTFTGPKFCCHFHKRNPKKYCLRKYRNLPTKEQKMWEKCAGQGSGELRHLMDDLKRHRIYDCEVCFVEFDTSDRYQNHIDDKKCDPKAARNGPRRDGIDRFQWRKIQEILKEKEKNDTEKWMDIWKVLFPYAPPPSDPWTSEQEDATEIPTSSPAVEKVIDTWQKLIQADILEGNLPSFSDSSHQRYELQLRRALHIEHRISEPRRPVVAMPTPSSSVRSAYTPASDSQNSTFAGTPSFHSRDLGGIDGLRSPPGNGFSFHQQMSPSIAVTPSLMRVANSRTNDSTGSLRRRISTSALMRNLEEEFNSTREDADVAEIPSVPSPSLPTGTWIRASVAVPTNYSTAAPQLSHESPAMPTTPVSLIQSADARSKQLLLPESTDPRTIQGSQSTHSPSRTRRIDSVTHTPGPVAQQNQSHFPADESSPSNFSTPRTEPESHFHQVHPSMDQVLQRVHELEATLMRMQQSNAPQPWAPRPTPYGQDSTGSPQYPYNFSYPPSDPDSALHAPTTSSSMAPSRSLFAPPSQPWALEDPITGYPGLRDPNVMQQPHLRGVPPRALSYVYTPNSNTGISTTRQPILQNIEDALLSPSWLYDLPSSSRDNDQDDLIDYGDFSSR